MNIRKSMQEEKSNVVNVDNGTIYENIAFLDLRHLNSIEEIKKVRLIKNVAVVIFDSEASEDVKSGLITISMRNTASIIYAEKDYITSVYNGQSVLTTERLYNKKEIIIVNGRSVFLPDTTIVGEVNVRPKLIINGETYINNDMFKLFEIICSNGELIKGDFMYFAELNNCDFSKVVYDEIKPNTLVFLTGKIKFTEEITVKMLKDKNLRFSNKFSKIKASKSINEYISIKL